MSDNEKKFKNNIKNKLVVLSGKGGVGKSTVSANLAVSLAKSGFKTGLLDIDIHGPSIPTLFNLEKVQVMGDENGGIIPYNYSENLKIISIGFMIEDSTAPIIWRGAMKNGYIKNMLEDVVWGDLDYLVVDCPPGTGDEPLSILQMLGENVKTLVVTTPQKLYIVDVKKSINFCKKMNTNLVGVLENMSGFVCPNCKEIINIFDKGNGEKMAKEMDVNFLGKIPLDLEIANSADLGIPYVKAFEDSTTAKVFSKIAENL